MRAEHRGDHYVRIAPDSELGRELDRHVAQVFKTTGATNKSEILRNLVQQGLAAAAKFSRRYNQYEPSKPKGFSR